MVLFSENLSITKEADHIEGRTHWQRFPLCQQPEMPSFAEKELSSLAT
jgi:hypothetical protein